MDGLAKGGVGDVILVSPCGEDHALFQRMFGSRPAAQSFREAFQLLRRASFAVVICERFLPDGDWKDMLKIVSALPQPPSLVVASQSADHHLWAEVLSAGGYDVLPKPLDAAEMLWMVGAARRRWARRLHAARRPSGEKRGMFRVVSA